MLSSPLVLAALVGAAAANPMPAANPVKAKSVQTIHEFPPDTWIENLAVRPNGDIIATTLTSPSVYLVEVSTGRACTLARFPNPVNMTTGITQVEPDVFYVNSDDASFTDGLLSNSSAIWKLDVHAVTTCAALAHPLTPQRAFAVPTAKFLNGLTFAPSLGKLLAADSNAGRILAADLRSGDVSTFLDATATHTVPGGIPLGVNGVHVRGPDLFFTNSNRATYSRAPLAAPQRVDTLNNGTAADDFALAFSGPGAYAANGFADSVVFLDGMGGPAVSIASVKGPTAVQTFDINGQRGLYVSTSGGDAQYLTGGPVTNQGAIVKIELE